MCRSNPALVPRDILNLANKSLPERPGSNDSAKCILGLGLGLGLGGMGGQQRVAIS